MAIGLKRNIVQTEAAVAAAAYTTDIDLTVPADHIYIIKSVVVEGWIHQSASTNIGMMSFRVSDSAGGNFITRSTIVDGDPSSSVKEYFSFEFASPKADIVTALPADWGGSGGSTAYLPTRGQESALHNLKLGAGQILRFSPSDSGTSTGMNSNASHDVDFSVRVEYLDYTKV